MEVNYLVRPKDKEQSYILLYLTVNGVRYRFTTPFTILTKEWEGGRPKIKNTTKQLRSDLSILKSKVDLFINETVQTKNRVPTKNELQIRINEVLGKAQQIDLKSIYKQYLQAKSGRVEACTIQQIETSFNLLFAFNNRIDFNDINQVFGQKFTVFLSKQGYENVTVNKHHKNIKAFFNWCYSMDFTKSNLSKYFRNLEAKEKNIIALTEDEINILETAILNDRLDRIRDIFLFACYTGLRYSDVVRVNSQMLHGGEIHITQQKTKNAIQIPILSGTQRLLTKYEGVIPVISNQKANLYLKDLFKELKLKRLVFDEKEAKFKPLHDLITFHIGRKSFITIALSKGVNSKVVQSISGHKKDSVFNRYIAFSSQTRIDELSKMERPVHLKKAI